VFKQCLAKCGRINRKLERMPTDDMAESENELKTN